MKKVLFIGSRAGGDWGMDLVFSGLAQIYGHANIIAFPTHDKYRMGKPQLTGDFEKDYGAERRSLAYAKGYQDLRFYNSLDVNRELQKGNVEYIFLDERQESYFHYLSLRASIFDIPVVVVAGHDSFQNVSIDYVRRLYGKSFRMLFTDHAPEHESHPWLRYYAWSANFDHLWDPHQRETLLRDKIYDLCFMGYNSNPDRLRFVEHIRKRWGHLNNHIVLETRGNTFDQFVPKSEFFRKIAQSKVCLNFRGDARNGKALRFFEIPYVGSCMLSQEWDGMRDMAYAYEPGVSYVSFNDEASLDQAIQYLIENDACRELLARAGHLHTMNCHVSRARVEWMLRELNG